MSRCAAVMRGHTEASSSVWGSAQLGSMGTGPLVGASVAGAREEWVAQASASAIHATTKRQPWRVEWNLQLTTLLLVAALPAAFLLIRCHMQLAVSNRPINGGLRLLAEGEREGKGRTTPCRGDGLENKETPEGAGESIEHKMKRRAENVAKKLIQVTKDCSSVAPLLPTQFPIRVVDLFLGFCIQEVAALSALLAGQFEEQKVEVLQTAESAALEVMEICWQNTTTGKRNHACRLVEYVNDLRDAGPENPPLPNEERLTMLEELLELQETAIGMIDRAISSALMSRDSSRHLTPEAAHEFAEELKRVVYTRRSQVFRSKHLSHQLRTLEAERSRGKLVPLLNLNKVDRKPKQPLETQLADLVHGSYWVKIPQNKTDKTLQETPPRDEGSPVRRQELHSMRISANTGVRAPKTSFGGSRQMYEVPPRFQVRMERAQVSLPKALTTYPEQTQQTPGGISPPSEAQSLGAAQALPHQAPAILAPAGQLPPELDTPFSQLSVVSKLGRSDNPPSDPAASSLAARSQPTVPITKETLQATSHMREASWRFGVSTETTGPPWSTPQPQRASHLPQVSNPYLTFATAPYTAAPLRGINSRQRPSSMVHSQWRLVFPPVPPPSPFPFTTPQSIVSEATEILYSLRSQGPSEGIHYMPPPHSRPTSDTSCTSPSYMLTREQTI